MAFLVCVLTPRGIPMSTLEPADFLLSTEAMSPLKRKSHLQRLNSKSLKRLRLDPIPIKVDDYGLL